MREEREPTIEISEDARICCDVGNHWNIMLDENIKDKDSIHGLTWEVYNKYKDEFIKRYVLV